MAESLAHGLLMARGSLADASTDPVPSARQSSQLDSGGGNADYEYLSFGEFAYRQVPTPCGGLTPCSSTAHSHEPKLPGRVERELQRALHHVTQINPSAECQANVISRIPQGLTGHGRGAFDLTRFQDYLRQGASFVDGSQSTTQMRGGVYDEVSGRRFGDTTVGQFLADNPATTAVTSITSSTLLVFVGEAGVDGPHRVDADPARTFGFVFHEALHGYLGRVDADLMKEFGLSGSSDAISRHISRNCF
jgi:hypothetical protein